MNDNVKIALILAVTVILAEAIWIYFSPFQACVRNMYGGGVAGNISCITTMYSN